MRMISFALTTRQFLDGSKTVTRRLGWRHLKVGERLQAVEKCMGLKKGERHVRLGELEVVAVRRESLAAITAADCAAEGFPELAPQEFVTMFAQAHGSSTDVEVTRIEFKRINARDTSLPADSDS